MWKCRNRDPKDKIIFRRLATFLFLNVRQSFDFPAKWHQLVSVIN